MKETNRARGELAFAAALIAILAVTVVPLPPLLLDLLLALSLCAALVTFLVAFYVEKSLDFSAFPSLLLFITLMRLSLNVASSRLILTHGSDGTAAAGGIIKAFGEFAVGSNFVVGAVVFLILVIVNFIVITKGAERISEVSARFTLDSMPGKQMAIDADLGAGLIDEHQARARRKAVEQEADFHGAMDGASKFVRGDAIAGLMIVGINIVGGMIIGIVQQGMSALDAAHTYTLLSIGDGLVSQIPALLVSTGSALLITRTGEESLAGSMRQQLFSRSQPLQLASGSLLIIGILPGMPHLLFAMLAFLGFFFAKRVKSDNDHKASTANSPDATPDKSDPETQRMEIENALPIDLLSLDVGLDLLPMVDAARSGDLLGRIANLRKQLALELGIIIPPIHVHDDLRLKPGGYRISIAGVSVAEGEIRSGRLLAIGAQETSLKSLPGELVSEPTFGLPGKWIGSSERGRAEAVGCTVVDASSVVATHLTEIVRRYAADLLGRKEAQELLDLAGKQHGKVIEELVPHHLSLGDIIKVLRNLLREGVSVRDIRTVLECLADNAPTQKDPGELSELVRQRLSRRITRQHINPQGELRALVFAPGVEDLFRDNSPRGAKSLVALSNELEQQTRRALESDVPAVLVVPPDIRRQVAAIATRHVPGLAVLSFREVDGAVPFSTQAVVGKAALSQ